AAEVLLRFLLSLAVEPPPHTAVEHVADMPSPLQLVGHVSEVVEVLPELVALIAQVLRRNPCVPRLPLDCTVRHHNFGALPEEHFDQYAHPELLERGK